MSNPTDPTPVATLVTEESTEATVEKQSRVRQGVDFVKNHKKASIALALGTVLVGAAAVTGRKTAPSPLALEPSEESMEEAAVALEEMNIPVSQEN